MTQHSKFSEAAPDLYESNKRLVSDGSHLKRERTLTPGPSPKGRGESDAKVSDGFLLKREDRSQKDLYLQLIDYSELVAFRDPNPGEVPSIVGLLEAEACPHVIVGVAYTTHCQAVPDSFEIFHKKTLQFVKKNIKQ
jgi:hypothetical protein